MSGTGLVNACMLLIAAAPGVACGWLLTHFDALDLDGRVRADSIGKALALCAKDPLLGVNLAFFVGVDVWFWVLSLLQNSTWLIDPYWTFLPVLMGWFYAAQPGAGPITAHVRCTTATALLLLWSARLTHSYFRREEWQFGAREDWRFADLRRKCGGHWWWLSFFAVYVCQHLMLVGISLPLLPLTQAEQPPWHPLWDSAIGALCLTGICLAWVADNQLRDFMVMNEERRARGQAPVLLLDTGVWRYSRHPNYFGEQLWWWALGLWAVHLGRPWMLIGTAFNSAIMVAVTFMVEAKMVARRERAQVYKDYQRATSVWVPWLKRGRKMA